MRKNIFILLVLIVLVALLITFEVMRPQPADWSYDYRSTSKKPYGCYVFADMIKKIFPDKNFRLITNNLYDFYQFEVAEKPVMYIHITDQFDIDSLVAKQIIELVSSGNAFFISAQAFNPYFLKTIGVDYKALLPNSEKGQTVFELTNPVFSKKQYAYKKLFSGIFSSFDSSRTTIIGRLRNGQVNFIRMKFGGGLLFLHTAPEVFSNYNLLYENKSYPMDIMAYFRGFDFVWDDYLKPGNIFKHGTPSPLRFILGVPALKMAYYVLISGLFIFILFNAKRRQRIIPVIHPPVNNTLEFVSTISALYQSTDDHKYMAQMKFKHFCEYVYFHYQLNLSTDDDRSMAKLAEKTGADPGLLKEITEGIKKINNKRKISSKELITYARQIDKMYSIFSK
jgi:hypothetical protein